MRPAQAVVAAASATAAALTAHTAWNLRHLRAAPPAPASPDRTPHVAVLLPARDEAHRIAPCLRALRAQRHAELTVLVLDDGSTDATADVVRALADQDARLRLIEGGLRPPPDGWLGKSWACQRLADLALGSHDAPDLLVFLDADVVLAPDAISRLAALVAATGLDLASPYPRQEARTPTERLVQPLLQWSWLTTLPLALAERSALESLTAANGQLLAITPEAYRRCGGHAAVAGVVLEDVALARAVKRTGGRALVTDGTDLATCRMYASTRELVDGYAKSLWAAFGSPGGALAVTTALSVTYVLPPAAAVLARSPATRSIGALGYAAAVLGRVMVARRTGQHVADSALHPASILALDALTALSFRRRRHGTIRWKGRGLPGRGPGDRR